MRQVRVLRVFTRGDDGGNQLGVVVDLDGLDDDRMQAIATELNYSETIYLDPPDVRIFTPATELRFAGHPLVGGGWVLADGVDGSAGVMRCGIGEVDYEIDGDTRIEVPRPGPVSEVPDLEALIASCSLPPPTAAHMVEVPQPYVVYEVAEAGLVADHSPDLAAIEASAAEIYLIATDGDAVRARFFAPKFGVPEDPATGSAAVALATLRMHQGEAAGALTIEQGEEVDAPSTIRLKWGKDRVSIGGSVREDEPRQVD